jgi:hypothetical protein
MKFASWLFLTVLLQDPFKKSKIESLPPEADPASLAFSPDGNGYAYAISSEAGRQYVVRGQKTDLFDQVEGLVLARAGTSFAFRAHRDGGWHAVHDGKAGKGYAAIRGPALSADGKTWACTALEGETWRLIVDGREARVFEGKIELGEPVVSSGGEIVAYGVRETTGNKTVEYMVWGEKTSARYERVWAPTLSANGGSILFYARKDGRSLAVLDERESEAYDEMVLAPSLSPDGATAAYCGVKGEEIWFVVGDKRFVTDEQRVMAVFSPDGKAKAFAMQSPTSWRVEFQGKRGRTFSSVGGLRFRADGGAVAYVGRNTFGACVASGDRQSGYFDRVGGIAFSPDGKKVGFYALRKREITREVLELGE